MKKKVAVVTGGSSGIGLDVVKNLSLSGWTCVSWDLKQGEDHALPYLFCDVSSPEAVETAYTQTCAKYGAPIVLINNCGLQYMSKIEDFPLSKWNQLISVMLTGTFLCSKALIPGMKENKWGRIINISSVHGKLASPYKAAYVAAKHGILGLSKVMALELAEYGITVNSICPGFVDTPLMRAQIQDQAKLNKMSEQQVIDEIMLKPAAIKKFTSPQQIAELVSYFISDSASTITGEAFNLSGGWGMGQ